MGRVKLVGFAVWGWWKPIVQRRLPIVWDRMDLVGLRCCCEVRGKSKRRLGAGARDGHDEYK